MRSLCFSGVLVLFAACSGASIPLDSGSSDGGSSDGGSSDGGSRDGGSRDGGSRDAGTVDGGPLPAQWGHCPSASEHVGDPGWTIELGATPTAIYCATFDESRTLVEELAAKAMLRIVPGAYRIPATDGEAPFFLPLCVDFGDGAPPTTTGTGTISHSSSQYMGTTYHRDPFRVDLTRGRIEGSLDPIFAGAPSPMVLDGRPYSPFGEDDTFTFNYCPDEGECWGLGSRHFDSCTYEGTAPQLHHVMLASESEVHFELRIGQSAASTEPGAFVRAHGRFAGVDFDQRDYWHLVYNPTHHHFERDFAVLFAEPIDGACGLEVINLEPWDDYQADQAFAVDCALNRLREVAVVSHTWERPPP